MHDPAMPPARSKMPSPALAALAVLALFILMIHPFGEYPVNDDWTFAWVAKRFAETGIFSVSDVPVAPSLYGQSLLVAPLIRLFGFSHLLLRAVTWVLAGVMVLTLDRILALASVRPALRFVALLLFLVNPMTLHLANSFMTEFYGLTYPMLGAWIWFRDRSIREQRGDSVLLSWPGALLPAAIIGASFWTRQTCVLVFPALIASSFGPRWKASAPRLLAAVALFSAIVLAYFPWFTAHQPLRAEFSSPLTHLLSFDFQDILRGWTAFAFYMTAFLLPLLWIFPREVLFQLKRKRPYILAGVAVLTGMGMFYFGGSRLDWIGAWIKPRFPMLGNIIII